MSCCFCVFRKALYESRLFLLLCAVISFSKKCFKRSAHIFKKMNLTLNLCLHILLFVQNTVFYMFALTAPATATIASKTSSQFRTKWQIHPSGCKQWSSPKPHVGQSVIMEAEAADGSIRFSSWLVRNTVGVFRKEREGEKKEKGLEWAVAGCCRWALPVSSHDEWISFTSIWCWTAIIGLFTQHRGTWGLTISTPGGRWTSALRPLDSDPRSITLCSAGYPQLTS